MIHEDINIGVGTKLSETLEKGDKIKLPSTF